MIAHIYVHGSGQAVQEFADVHPGQVELFRGQQKVWSPSSRYSKFEKLPDGHYANTDAAGAYLCRSSPVAMTGYVLYSDEVLFRMWANLADAVREGTHRWPQTFGSDGPIFDHFFRDAESMRTRRRLSCIRRGNGNRRAKFSLRFCASSRRMGRHGCCLNASRHFRFLRRRRMAAMRARMTQP